ncbi:predicted protein [Aspergillus terreus NIH2624]|uniref:Uncharacterized protein n=1 Tax=Aspergillus terreus (strain NIH 2624 / FGSC A1156) TaxID=341663 RepID=Q0CCW6_ASPTN|nr:uncharacterized protein ATEG_08468 [Aspergillus terreus NIH2624]EAU31641.1 predicted protein [Aspergillus terreus NIH2624]
MRLQPFQLHGECAGCRTPNVHELFKVHIFNSTDEQLMETIRLPFHPAITLQCVGDQLMAKWPSTGRRPITDITKVWVWWGAEVRHSEPGGGLCCWHCPVPALGRDKGEIHIYVRLADGVV